MIRNYFLLITLICSCFQLSAQKKEIIDKVVAVVGSELVLLSDLEEQYNYVLGQQGTLPPDFKCNILDNLLANGLLVNQAKLDSLEVGEDEVEGQLDARFDQILNYMNNDAEQFYNYYGQTIPEMKEKMRNDLKNQILSERMRETVLGSISITPAEVKKFFSQIPVDSLPYFNSEVELAEIIYKPKVNEIEKSKAREKLEGLRDRIINDGEDFGDLAKLYSDDPGSGRAGGDLGWAKRGSYVPEFEATGYSLEENELSEIIETQFGFHILQQIGRRGNNIHLKHILVKPEITDNDLELAQQKLEEVRNLIVTDSLTFSKAVKKYSSEDVQSYTNDGNLINPGSGNTFFEIGDLEDPEIYFTIDTMEIGQISTPFAFKVGPGETAYRIIYLKSRTKPHKASLELDYSKIKAAATEQKKQNFLNEWVADKVDNTYIQIDQNYQSCPLISSWLKKSLKP